MTSFYSYSRGLHARLFTHCLVVLASLFLGAGLVAQDEPASKSLYIESQAMDTSELPPQTANFLDNYFRRSFGGLDNWESLRTFRFEGRLHFQDITLRFTAFKMKPNKCKVVVYGEMGQRMIMAYDGEDAWQLLNLGSAKPEDMPKKDARNFIRDSEMGGSLLYPQLEGKRIEQLPSRRVKGMDCAIFRVIRPDGEQVEYALDVNTFTERQMIVTNAVTGLVEKTTHFDHKRIEGVQVPFRSVLEVDGKKVHEVELEEVLVNEQVSSWMFMRSSAANYVPTSYPPMMVPEASEGVHLNLDFPGQVSIPGTIAPEVETETRNRFLNE